MASREKRRDKLNELEMNLAFVDILKLLLFPSSITSRGIKLLNFSKLTYNFLNSVENWRGVCFNTDTSFSKYTPLYNIPLLDEAEKEITCKILN